MSKSMMKRRKFIKTTATGAAAVVLAPEMVFNTNNALATTAKSRVVVASNQRLVNDSHQIEEAIVRKTLDEVLIALTNKPSIQDAWMHIFPNLQSSDIIGLKVNCINRKLSTHPEVAHAIANSLIESLKINPNNILIWDRSDKELKKSGYTFNKGQEGIRCFGTVPEFSRLEWVFNITPEGSVGYDNSRTIDLGNETPVHLSRILSEICTYLINVPVLKDHNYAGVTLAMKNHYGSIDKPQTCHGGSGDPYIGNLNNVSHIKDKTKLIVCDALFSIFDGGPFGAPQWVSHSLLAATDPVAHDHTGMEILDKKRIENKIDPIAGEVTFFKTAVKLGLGTNDPKNIEKIML